MRNKTLLLLFFAFAIPSSATETAPDPTLTVPAVVPSTSTPPSGSTGTWRSIPNEAFKAGEDLQFVVKWGVITGGRATMTLPMTEIVNGRPAFRIVSEARSAGIVDGIYHVRDKNESWLDVESLVAVRYEKHIREGKYKVEESGIIDQVAGTFTMQSYRIDKNRYENKQGTVPVNVQDILSSLYYLRTQPLIVGDSYTIDVLSGEKVWPLLVNVKKRETVKVPAGKFDCFLLEPILREPGIFIAKGRKLEVWVTADRRRMPVRMRSEVVIGHVGAELISFTGTIEP